MNEIEYNNAYELIKLRLDKTNISESAKEELGKKAEGIYHQLRKRLGKGYSKDELIDIANSFACDTTYCAIPRQLPQTRAKLRKKARKITGIQAVIKPDARTDKIIKLLENSLKYPISESVIELVKEKLRNKAKETIEKYLRIYSEMKATVPSDSVNLTAAAYYIAANHHFGYHPGKCITQKSIAESLGISEIALRNRYKEMAKTLDVEVILQT